MVLKILTEESWIVLSSERGISDNDNVNDSNFDYHLFKIATDTYNETECYLQADKSANENG